MRNFPEPHFLDVDHGLLAEISRKTPAKMPLAWALAARGCAVDTVNKLISGELPAEDEFHDSLLLGEMAQAVERIRSAIADKQTIVVHGDYDADGICSTVLLAEALDELGAEVRPFLPNRFENGYGLTIDSVEKFAIDGARLLILVDCGITAVEQVAQARSHGIDVIICDHHQPGEVMPDAIICSTRPSTYPFPHLCAASVAGKLVSALGATYGPQQWQLEAIATVADCVPLYGENRAIAVRGLNALKTAPRVGIAELMKSVGRDVRSLTAEDVSFQIAPRLNAVGRLGDSDDAYELLRSPGGDHSIEKADVLHNANLLRRETEKRITTQAVAQIESWSDQQRSAKIYVLSGKDWHQGVVGIVASRIVERYGRPTIVIAEEDPLSRGSGRSVANVDLHAAVAATSDCLVKWGGHRQAVGVTIDTTDIAEFRKRIAEWAEKEVSDADLQQAIQVDAPLAYGDIGMALASQIEMLAPFGEANQKPVFMMRGAVIRSPKAIGDGGGHLRCRLEHGGTSVQAIGFGFGKMLATDAEQMIHEGSIVDVCVHVSVNRFRGAESLQVEIVGITNLYEPLSRGASNNTADCDYECRMSCALRRDMHEVLADPQQFEYEGALPGPEMLLAKQSTVDLRGTEEIESHIERLVAANTRVVVVCTDVVRRRRTVFRNLFDTLAKTEQSSYVQVGDRCSTLHALSRLEEMVESESASGLLLTDHVSIPTIAELVDRWADVIVVVDPPLTMQHLERLASFKAPLHLVFGAAENRFSTDAANHMIDLRANLGGFWKSLSKAQEHAPLDSIIDLLWCLGQSSEPDVLPTPTAIGHALYTLRERRLISLQDGRISLQSADVS